MALTRSFLLGCIALMVVVDTAFAATATGTSTQNVGKSGNGGAGYSGTKGKNGDLNLKVEKRYDLFMTDMDRLLFQDLRDLSATQEALIINGTVSYEYVISTLEIALGDYWYEMVELPTEELSLLEFLRLTASLNEFTISYKPGNGNKLARQIYSGSTACLCHGTAAFLKVSREVEDELVERGLMTREDLDSRAPSFWKESAGLPFKGVRIMSPGNGHFKQHKNTLL